MRPGRRPEAVYRRYAIVGEQDLHEAARKLATSEHGRVIELARYWAKWPPHLDGSARNYAILLRARVAKTGRRAGLSIVRTPEAHSTRMRDLVRKRWAKAKKGF